MSDNTNNTAFLPAGPARNKRRLPGADMASWEMPVSGFLRRKRQREGSPLVVETTGWYSPLAESGGTGGHAGGQQGPLGRGHTDAMDFMPGMRKLDFNFQFQSVLRRQSLQYLVYLSVPRVAAAESSCRLFILSST